MFIKSVLSGLALALASMGSAAVLVTSESFPPENSVFSLDAPITDSLGKIAIERLDVNGADSRTTLPRKGWDGTIKGKVSMHLGLDYGTGLITVDLSGDESYDFVGDSGDPSADSWTFTGGRTSLASQVTKVTVKGWNPEGKLAFTSPPGSINPQFLASGEMHSTFELSIDGGATWSTFDQPANLSLQAVPEPATLACLGFGLMAVRRQRKS